MFHFRPIPFFGAVAALLLTGCYDSRFGEPDDDGEGKPATETIAALRDRYAGTPFTVTGDIVVTGRVASCDRAENFYRTLCICDAEAGLEVMAGIDHLHNGFPIGSRVTLSLRGLAIAESRGVLQAGRPPAAGSGYATDYIGSRAALGSVLVRSGEALAAPSPAPLAIPALTESRCGTLVRIDGVRYPPRRPFGGNLGGLQTLHRRRRQRRLHLRPPIRPFRRRRSACRHGLADGHSPVRRRGRRALHPQTAR